jgi:23S rRNA (cytosine1962-C5)-methyltransferase
MHSKQNTYALIDSGHGRKLEQFGPYLISRPAAQAVWHPQLPENKWKQADAIFTRETENRWIKNRDLPEFWTIDIAGIQFKIAPTDFGHLGVFPEQRDTWDWIQRKIQSCKMRNPRVLNLFAYSGGATFAAAKAGAQVCHLDSSKGMVAWARENAELNQLKQAPIKWIVEDVNKYLKRELRRGSRYEGIILDPPSFGRGSKGEVFKIEKDLPLLLEQCRDLLSEKPLFVLFSCHTPGFTPIVTQHLLAQMMGGEGTIESGEMVLAGNTDVFPLPSGTYARWSYD